MLGQEGFVEKFRDFLEDKRQTKEIPRLQRYANRPSLDVIFSLQKTKAHRDRTITAAHIRYGYTMKQIADYLGMHYTTISKVITKSKEYKK